MSYSITASPRLVQIKDQEGESIFSLPCEPYMMKFTANMLVKFCEQKEKGIAALLSISEPSGYWYEDKRYTKDLALSAIMFSGSDLDKFIEMANINPALIRLKAKFCLQLDVI